MPMNTIDHITEEGLNHLGLRLPELYLPAGDLNLAVWPVIACDQFTSQPAYWQETESIVGEAPSTLRLILPELYLDHPGDISVEDRIKTVNGAMQKYLDDGIIVKQQPGCVLLDRSTPLHPSRLGLVIAVDLEQYDFTPGNKKMIRATEGTVLERIPPRQAIRRNAPLELPHVQLLIDDPDRTVIEPIYAALSEHTPIYDTELMQGGGHIRGWFLPEDSKLLAAAINAMSQLTTLANDNLLFAVGDGNHSLATAQAHWHEIRSNVPADHPARYALVEIINIHDTGLEFEPIHRSVFGINTADFLKPVQVWLEQHNTAVKASGQYTEEILPVYSDNELHQLTLAKAENALTAALVQQMLDELSEIWKKTSGFRIDYIHGEETVKELAADGAAGIILPPFAKNSFFEAIIRDGILPRKTFSMGEAFEKRYYFECRKIRQDDI